MGPMVVELTDVLQADVGELNEMEEVLPVGRKIMLNKQWKRWLVEEKKLCKIEQGK